MPTSFVASIPAALRACAGVLVCGLLLTLAACGGGSGSSPPAITPPPPVAPAPPPLIDGDSTKLVSAALLNVQPTRVSPADTTSGYLLTRVVAGVQSTATVAQLNAAAATIGATAIASSGTGSLLVSLTVPRQASIAALRTLATTLQAQPGIDIAWAAREAKASVLPVTSPGHPAAPSVVSNLLASRFPQAWNARQAAPDHCESRVVPIYVLDEFGAASSRPSFFSQIDPSLFIADPKGTSTFNGGHGYDVVSVIAGAFDATPVVGANPFLDCVEIDQFEALGLDYSEALRQVTEAAAGDTRRPLILNLSIIFDDSFCGPTADQPCDATTIPITSAATMRGELLRRVRIAAQWANNVKATNLPTTLLITQAVGNIDPAPRGELPRDYPGFRNASFSSAPALATHLAALGSSLSTSELWKNPTNAALPDATFDTTTAAQVQTGALLISGGSNASRANLLLVDSGTNGSQKLEDVQISDFDFAGADIRTVAEDIQLPDVTNPLEKSGTSFAAPQIAGLASYLWVLSPTLRAKDVKDTVDLLKNASRTTPNSAVPVIDALNAVLALDSAGTRPLTRLGMLDVNGDGVFDHIDLEQFEQAYGLGNQNTPEIPAAPDFSRFDLNGDSFTGGILIGSFDLDMTAANNSGPPAINQTTVKIEGFDIVMNEAALTDLQVLCYYAYAIDANGNNLVYDSRDDAIKQRTVILGPDQCVKARLTVNLPSKVPATASPLNVTVQLPAGNGQYAPGANVLVDFTATCATVSPTSGRTDESGHVATNVTPNTGCTHVSVDTVARADTGTAPLAEQIASADVGAFGIIPTLYIQTSSGFISATTDITQTNPPVASGNDVASFEAELSNFLAGATGIGSLAIDVGAGPQGAPLVFDLNFDMAIGGVVIKGLACQSSITLTIGDITPNIFQSGFDGVVPGQVEVGGCLAGANVSAGDIPLHLGLAVSGNAQVTARNVGPLTVDQCNTLGVCGSTTPPVLNIHATTMTGLVIEHLTNTTLTISGTLQGIPADPNASLQFLGNTNLTLGGPVTANSIGSFTMTDNSFASPPQISTGALFSPPVANRFTLNWQRNTGLNLSRISVGAIAGNLNITLNHGFSDDDANAFAQSHSPAGSVTVGGNVP